MSRQTIDRIIYLLDRNRKEARQLYEEVYTNPYASSVEDELGNIVRGIWRQNDSESVEIPIRLVIAILLRAHWGGNGRRRPPKERWARRQSNLAVRIASTRWAELVALGMAVKEAKYLAANEVLPLLRSDFKFAGIGLGTLISRMRLGEHNPRSSARSR